MISYLEGKLVDTGLESVVIDVGGIGYEVYVASDFISRIPASVELLKVYIHHHFREDGQALYGFWTILDRQAFRLLISVSGIGPKVALSILSSLSTDRLLSAINNQDEHLLSTAQGVGKKTAARVILELHSKVSGMSYEPVSTRLATAEKIPTALTEDLVSALVSLGYSARDVQRTLTALTEEERGRINTIEAGIKLVLQKIH